MLTITDLLPKDAIIVEEALTTAVSLPAFLPMRDRYAYFGNVSGGIGWGIGAAVGLQLGRPKRRVVALLGDGSAMYSIQSLWTAAHHKLQMTFVLFNRGGCRIIKQRLKLFHDTDRFIGMDFTDPSIEFAALAAALGAQGHRVATPAAFEAAVAEGVAAWGADADRSRCRRGRVGGRMSSGKPSRVDRPSPGTRRQARVAGRITAPQPATLFFRSR